jgi:hypothetical protein
MSHDAYLFVGWALITISSGLFVTLVLMAVWNHFAWKRRSRKRIGWYS